MEDKVYTLSQVRRLEWWPIKSDFGMRTLIKEGALPLIKIGNRYYFEEKGLRSFLNGKKKSYDGEMSESVLS